MPDLTDAPSLLAIERAGVHAWPAHRTECIGGWLWRYSNGGSQRANSVATLASPGADLEAAITTAERLYTEAGAPAQFQVTDASEPCDLDLRLERRGYRIVEPCLTIARPLGPRLAVCGLDAEISSAVSDGWFEAYASVITADRRAQAHAILTRVPAPRAFSAVRRAGRIVATTLCVIDGRIAIIECVATRTEARRTGAGRTAVETALAWAADQGATTAALGVAAANRAALGLYQGLGFAPRGRYHTRVRDTR